MQVGLIAVAGVLTTTSLRSSTGSRSFLVSAVWRYAANLAWSAAVCRSAYYSLGFFREHERIPANGRRTPQVRELDESFEGGPLDAIQMCTAATCILILVSGLPVQAQGSNSTTRPDVDVTIGALDSMQPTGYDGTAVRIWTTALVAWSQGSARHWGFRARLDLV
jgi:hypothetical protein